MGVLKTFKYCTRVIGFKEQDKQTSAQVYLYICVILLMLVNIGCFISDRWQDLDARINGLKAFMFLVTYLAYALSFVFCWNDFSPVLHMFYQTNFKFPFEVSPQRRELMDLMNSNMQRFHRYWRIMIIVHIITFDSIPAVVILARVFLFSEQFHKLIKEYQSSPFPLYYPEYIKRFGRSDLEVVVFVVAYVVHSCYTMFMGFYAYLAHVTPSCAMASVEFELKFLRLSLMEMKQIAGTKANSNGDIEISQLNLRKFLRYFVQQHQHFYRRFEVVNRGIRWVAAILSTTASLYMCMSIYTIVQKDQVVLKGQEAIFLSLWAFAIYLFDSCGEKVETEDKNLRNALFEFDWTDKPEWFKKSLLISMTRASKPIGIKPFGIFKLNLNSFALTMNAAYSYYNLLYKLKRKSI